MSSPQPQMVAQQQMTAEAPAENQARVSSEQPRPVEPMSVEANMRGGGEGDVCCGICAGIACFECCECCC